MTSEDLHQILVVGFKACGRIVSRMGRCNQWEESEEGNLLPVNHGTLAQAA